MLSVLTEELLRDLPRTEDLCRLVLEWLGKIENEHTVEQMGETDKNIHEEELAENGLTASHGGPPSSKEGSTAIRGAPPKNPDEGTLACSHCLRQGPVHKVEPLQGEDIQSVFTHTSIQGKLIAYNPLAIPCLCFLVLGSKSLHEEGNDSYSGSVSSTGGKRSPDSESVSSRKAIRGLRIQALTAPGHR